jgi:hypothetical protein
MQRYSYEEMILLRLLELNMLMPHYWSELFLLSFQLFDPKTPEYEQLQQMIAEVEWYVLDEDQIDAGYSLYDVEMALESNADYYAYFEKGDGSIVTKFDIERRLNGIKSWVYQNVRARAVSRKFQRYR